MTDRPAISLWDTTADESDVAPAALGDASVDLAIVGGGFTGLSTALHAAERGIEAHVLEARHIGHGGSGRVSADVERWSDVYAFLGWRLGVRPAAR